MLNLKQIGIIAGQSAIAGVVGFAVTSLLSKPGVSRLAIGSFGAIILGGNLAVFYSAGAFGESKKMAEWKVRLLQAAAMGVYNLAVLVTCVASGIMLASTAFWLGIMTLTLFTFMPGALGIYQRSVNPHHIYKNALPESLFSFPKREPLDLTEAEIKKLLFQEIMLQLNLVRSMPEPHRSECFALLLNNSPLLNSDELFETVRRYVFDNSAPQTKHRPQENLKLGRSLIENMKEAKKLVIESNSSNYRHYTQQDIANIEGDPFWSITVLGIYLLIAKCHYNEGTDVLGIGTGEDKLELCKGKDVLEWRKKLVELHKLSQQLSETEKTVLTLQLTRADQTVLDVAMGALVSTDRLEKIGKIYNGITDLKGEVDKHLVSSYGYAPEDTLDFNQVFA